MYNTHTSCRACGFATSLSSGIKAAASEFLTPVFNLGVQPLANSFRKPGEEHPGFAPLQVLYCPRCTLAQLSVVVKPEILYDNYPYVTSTSHTMQTHFETLRFDISNVTSGRKLLEIGSNDGGLLERFHSWGYSVMGVDPAKNLVEISKNRGIKSLCAMWNEKTAGMVKENMVPDIILARHVFCHIDDWKEFFRALEIVSSSNTIICIEVPHCQDLLERAEFDTIYHEHLSYLTLGSIRALLKDSPFNLFKVIRYPIHGGAILLMLDRNPDHGTLTDDMAREYEEEKCGLEQWKSFAIEAKRIQEELASFVRKVRAEGKTVAGLGASAKSTVWMNACGFTRKDISFICDSTPQKWYTTSPGTDIPVTDEGGLLRELPVYTVMFAWNYASEILKKFSLYRDKGGKFIVPIPSLQVI